MGRNVRTAEIGPVSTRRDESKQITNNPLPQDSMPIQDVVKKYILLYPVSAVLLLRARLKRIQCHIQLDLVIFRRFFPFSHVREHRQLCAQ
jgi:hypothetical protein